MFCEVEVEVEVEDKNEQQRTPCIHNSRCIKNLNTKKGKEKKT